MCVYRLSLAKYRKMQTPGLLIEEATVRLVSGGDGSGTDQLRSKSEECTAIA